MPASAVEQPRGGALRRALRRLTVSEQQLDAEVLHEQVLCVAGAIPCRAAGAGSREPVRLVGRLRSVRFIPHAKGPTLEAELYDGTGTVNLVWLGRRRIAGIEPGRSLVVRGRVVEQDTREIIYNPWYELLPASR